MENKFHIEGNNFYDNSSMFRASFNQTPEVSLNDIYKELSEINEKLNPTSQLYLAISELQHTLNSNNPQQISTTIGKFAADFSSSFFSGIASTALLQFIQGFLN